MWKSIRAGGKVTIGTLFYEAKANGWRDDGMHRKPTPAELAERWRMTAERAAKEEAEIARERADTAKKAAAILQAAREATADHPYLERKRVSPVASLREIDAGAVAAILGYAPKSSGELLTGRLLVILADLVKATGEPDPHAIEAARAVGGKLAIPDFGSDRDSDMTDLNDVQVLGGMDHFRCQLETRLVAIQSASAGVLPVDPGVRADDARPARSRPSAEAMAEPAMAEPAMGRRPDAARRRAATADDRTGIGKSPTGSSR